MVDAPKQAWAGISVGNLQTHILTSREAFSESSATGASRAAKKSKGKGKMAQTCSPGLSEHTPFIETHDNEYWMHEIDKGDRHGRKVIGDPLRGVIR